MNTELRDASDAGRILRGLERGTTVDEALAFFDTLPAVTVDEMWGSWAGHGVETGHPFDGLLEGLGWHGKRFKNADSADPLVFRGRRRLFALNPALMPLGVAVRFSGALQRPVVQRMLRPLLPVMSTRRPAARLRMIEYRGVSTATMSYDALAINDHFRRVDEDTLIGAMDLRGVAQPFMFALRHEGVRA